MTVVAKPPKPPAIRPGGSQAAAIETRRTFAMAYLLCKRNGTEAAKMAGYAESGAHVRANEMLKEPDVIAMIQELADKSSAEAGLTLNRTLLEAKRNAFNDPRRFFRPDGSLKGAHEWDDDMAAAVASIEVTAQYAGHGEDRRVIGTTAKLKFNSKINAIDMLMKHQGLYERDNAQRVDNLALQVVVVHPPVAPETMS